MSKRLAIGVDLGGTNLRVALVTEDGEIIRKVEEPVFGGVIDLTIRLAKGFVNEEIAGIGLGVAGLIERESSKVLISPNLPAVEGVSLVSSIKEKFRVPVFIENDANAAAFGEKWVGIGKEFSSFVLFILGTGIGGGIIHDKKLLKVAAEIGHITIHADGEKCHCGNSGCLEIANIINVMSPEAIVLAGGLTGAWDIYIQEAIREASRRSFKELFNKVKIIPSLLGDDAGVIGSAGIVFENMINRRISE